VSRLSEVRWQSVEAVRKSYSMAAAIGPEAPIARLVRQTDIPDLKGTPRDKALELLRIVAEVEHAFVVQYLYGAFSLRQDDPNGKAWYRTLFGIAQEEMGHLITVQNLLLLFGEPPHLGRQSYPAPPSYLFEKMLRQFSPDWLGDFVLAESPVDAALPPGLKANPGMRRVATFYTYLYWLFKDSEQPE
jgi:hypothetical protein